MSEYGNKLVKALETVTQLKARVEELEEFVSDLYGKGYSIDGYNNNGELEAFDLFVEDAKILTRKLPTSLLLHDAEVGGKALEEFAETVDFDIDPILVGELRDTAARLRLQAEEKGDG